MPSIATTAGLIAATRVSSALAPERSSATVNSSARAAELTVAELRSGARALETRVAAIKPAVVAMLGITAYRIAFERPEARVGLQPEPLGGSSLWVVPNPSGLNAHAPLATLAATYREVAVAAGIDVFDPPQV